MKKSLTILFTVVLIALFSSCEDDTDFRDNAVGKYNCQIQLNGYDVEEGTITVSKAESSNKVLLKITGFEDDFDLLCQIEEVDKNVFTMNLLSDQSFFMDGTTYKVSKIGASSPDGKIIYETKSIVFQFRLTYSDLYSGTTNNTVTLKYSGKKNY